MAVKTESISPYHRKHLRPIDARRDLNAVADLVELCFAENLDQDGKRYLNNMRAAARDKGPFGLAAYTAVRGSLPLSGFVWEEDNQVVGNLSLIPFFSQGRRVFLIANVAVHPDYRSRGIARALTSAALEKTSRSSAYGTWLQARDDNPAALNLYSSIGFSERARRTTWNIESKVPEIEKAAGVEVGARKKRHWPQQQSWLRQNYPKNLHWHLAFSLTSLQPGLLGSISRFLNNDYARHWAVQRRKQLLGVLSWQPSRAYADRLWLAAPPEDEDLVIRALFSDIHWKQTFHRPLSLDYPAGRGVDALQDMGFKLQHTLIWMERRF